MNKVQARSMPGGETASGPDYVLERQVGHLLRRAHQRHAAIFLQHIGDQQLTPLQFAALAKLRDVDEVSQNQLGRMTAMDAATMQGVIKRLAARRLIRRRPDPDDRRRLILSLSSEGRALIDRLVADGSLISELTLEPLNAAERRTLLDLLTRIAE